jgi:3-hexulose-6-phosphate synthase
MKPIVQISLDLTDIREALETARIAVEAGVDWLEAGTPLILAEGLHGVRALRQEFPTIRSSPTSRPWTGATSRRR